MEDVDSADTHQQPPRPIFKPGAGKAAANKPAPSTATKYVTPATTSASRPNQTSAQVTSSSTSSGPAVTVITPLPPVYVVGGKERKNFFASMDTNKMEKTQSKAEKTLAVVKLDKVSAGGKSDKPAFGTLDRPRPPQEQKSLGGTLDRYRPPKSPAGTLERPRLPPPPAQPPQAGNKGPPPPYTLVVAADNNTLKRKDREGSSSRDRPSVSPPLSPTKAPRKPVQYSQSCRETRPKDALLPPGEKLVKRESFRGAEISSPVLVSTTNRDSQVILLLTL
jgi:hypothetical protein